MENNYLDRIIQKREAQSANFREICMGNIAPKTLYRSSHPIRDLAQVREIAVLAAETRISTVINLSDADSELKTKAFFAPWYNKLYKNNRVIALGMDFSFTGKNFQAKLKKALKFIIKTEGPWLIHCHAGVDRTGFVCMVLESFMGAELKDVIKDYLLSFNSIFESNLYTAEKADSITAMQILSVMSDSQIITEQNLQQVAEIYLRSKIGLSAEEVEILKGKLSGV
jgi:protein tyrosine/serine phosphatase